MSRLETLQRKQIALMHNLAKMCYWRTGIPAFSRSWNTKLIKSVAKKHGSG